MTESKYKPDAADETFATRAGARLRRHADELDATTLSRLNRARQHALDDLSARAGSWYPSGWWIPAGAAAIVVAIAVGQWGTSTRDPNWPLLDNPVTAKDAIDFELLMESEDLEMIADLEFFAWLPDEELEAAG